MSDLWLGSDVARDLKLAHCSQLSNQLFHLLPRWRQVQTGDHHPSITNNIERKKFKFLEQYITQEVYGPSGPLDFIPSRPSSGSTRHKMQETKNKLNNMMGRPIAFNKLKKTNIVKNE